MYYLNHDSYTAEVNNATAFEIVVKLKNGSTVSSSLIPIIAMEEVHEHLTTAGVELGYISVWNRKTKEIIDIPFNEVAHITLHLYQDTSARD